MCGGIPFQSDDGVNFLSCSIFSAQLEPVHVSA